MAKQGQGKQVIEVDGRELALTNLDKVLWPGKGGRGAQSGPAFTKGEAIDYYARIADTMLPHLRERALTRVRFPEGVEGQRFYEKRAPSHTPKWVKTAPIEMGRVGTLDFIVCNDRPTLIWLAQLAAHELHPSLSLIKAPTRPTVVAFDLDPGPPASIVECARVAIILRGLFTELGLESFPKTSGSKGLQVYVPLNNPTATYEQTKSYSRAVAQALERSEPDLVVSKQDKNLRKGKVLVDWSQNDYSKTTVAVYSLRCRPRPWVSTPLRWEEVEELDSKGDQELVRFEAADTLARVDEHGDLFAPVLELRQELPDA